MLTLELGDLTCTTQNESGSDEVLLELRLDGAHREPYPLYREMDAGDSWTIDRSYGFGGQATLTLLELDPVANDEIGSQPIDQSGQTTLSFEGDDAEYDLDVTVSQVSGTDPVSYAIDAFDNSTTSVVQSGSNAGNGTVWTGVSKQALVNRLRTLLPPGGNPNLLHQGGTPFCGTIALALGLAQRQPRRLVELTRGLFETGELLTVGEYTALSEDLRASPAPNNTRDLEWVVGASLRESKNWVIDVQNDVFLDKPLSLLHAGWPWVLRDLAADVLDFGNMTLYAGPTLETLLLNKPGATPQFDPVSVETSVEKAGEAYRNGGLGILLLDGSFVQGEKTAAGNPPTPITTADEPWVAAPTHYITCLDGNPVTGSDYTFRAQTWGGRVEFDLPVSEGNYYFFGTIAGYP